MKGVLNGREAQLFHGLDRAALLSVHRCMLLSRKLDDKEIQRLFEQVDRLKQEEARIRFERDQIKEQ